MKQYTKHWRLKFWTGITIIGPDADEGLDESLACRIDILKHAAHELGFDLELCDITTAPAEEVT